MGNSSKKCGTCGQWSVWNQQLEDNCEHCGKPLAIQEIKVRQEIQEREKKMEGYTIEVVKIHPDDNIIVVGIKKIIIGFQLTFMAIMSFLIWLAVTLAG
jgi:hypothetical protein